MTNLATDPLIPVTRTDGTSLRLGLRDLLNQAHEIRHLDIPIPPAESGLLRVLYTIVCRVTRLDTHTDHHTWAEHRNTILTAGHFDTGAVDTYLNKHNWELFDAQRPWMQDPRLTTQSERKTANVLDMTRPGDNSAIWWRHTHADHAPPLPAHEAVQWLLVHHYYGSGGAGGKRTVTHNDKTVSDQYMSSGPLRSVVAYYPLGETLFETLLAGIPAPSHTTTGDVAPWETELNQPLGTPPAPTWPAGILTAQSRHALLLDHTSSEVDGVYLTWAWKERHTPILDPFCIHNIDPKTSEPRPRRADASRAAWRDFDALLADRPTHTRPTVLADALTLPDDLQDTLRVRAIGWHQDRQATNTGWYVSETPPLLRYMDEHDPARAALAETLITTADKVYEVMRKALQTAWKDADLGDAKKCPWTGGKDRKTMSPIDLFYWPDAERVFWSCLNTNTPPEREFVNAAVRTMYTVTEADANRRATIRSIENAIRTVKGVK